MSYRNFGDYVHSFGAYEDRTALTMQPFLRIDRLTYGELQRLACQAAHYLQSSGIKRGDRVMIVSGNTPQWVVLFLGAQLIGVVIVPADVGSTPAAIKTFADQVKPKVVFRGKYVHADIGRHYPVQTLDDLYELIDGEPDSTPKQLAAGDNTSVIVFTSGTTADPKGVTLSQRNILANVEGVQRALTIDPGWRLLSVLPLSHMYEMTGSLAVLSKGASIYYLPRVTPAAIARGLTEYRITTLLAIPQLLLLFSERIKHGAAESGKAGLLRGLFTLARLLPFDARRYLFHGVHTRLGGNLQIVVTGGAPIPIDTATFWERMGVKALEGYGLTETSPVLAVNSLTKRRLNSSGRPLDNVQLRIAEDGEIQAKGPSIFGGYWHNKTATNAAFTSDGWFRTGDVGRLDDGWLRIQGRLKFAIVLSSGLKVFPEDIEYIATRDNTFKALCVVGVKRPEGETVQAVVVSDLKDAVVEAAIAGINKQVASFQHITDWRRWPDDDFPRTRLLKIDRKKVQQWANVGPRTEKTKAGDAATHDPLVQIIRLSLDDPGKVVKDSERLGDIGLDSLRRLNVVTLVEEQLGISIAEASVMPQTTVAALRTLVKQGQPAEPPKKRPAWQYGSRVRKLGNFLRDYLFWGIVHIWVRERSEGLDNLDGLNSPALFIFNHVDNFDGPVVYQALPPHIRRKLAVAVAADFMDNHKGFAFLARLGYGGFNIARSEPYMPSLAYACKLVDQGWHIALSPEGRISKTGELQSFKSGIGLLAVELGIPVVPVKSFGLYGTLPLHGRWPRRVSHIQVKIGKPVTFGRDRNYDDVTRELQRIIADL